MEWMVLWNLWLVSNSLSDLRQRIVYLPSKDIPIYRLFRNPINEIVYRKLAYDSKTDQVLAQSLIDNSYWNGEGSFRVELLESEIK